MQKSKPMRLRSGRSWLNIFSTRRSFPKEDGLPAGGKAGNPRSFEVKRAEEGAKFPRKTQGAFSDISSNLNPWRIEI
jgi:hypothetical protein